MKLKENRPESEIKKAILQYLNMQLQTFAFPVSTLGIPDAKSRTGFRKNPSKGVADIIGVKGIGQPEGGRFFALEVKRPGQKPTEEQYEFLRNVAIAGGYAGVVHSVEDVIEAFKEI